jgi:hypothetical protein
MRTSLSPVSKRFFHLAATAVLGLSLSACAGVNSRVSSITAPRPPEQGGRSELKKELSTVNISIAASSAELSDLLNRMVPKDIYKGSTSTSGVNASVQRNGAIGVRAADNALYLSVPLSVSLSYGIFQTPTIRTTMKFKVVPKVTPDWKLNAEVYYTGLADSLAQEISMGPISIKPRGLVEGLVNPVQRTVSQLLGNKLSEKLALKGEVAKAWTAAHQPILLDKNYNAWLKITPRELLLYPLYAQNDQLRLSVGLTSFAEVVVGPQPAPQPVLPLPNLKQPLGYSNNFRLAVNTDLFYKDVLAIAGPMLLNKDLGSDGKVVIVKELEIYGNGDYLVIRAVTAGSLEGTFYLTGKPVFDPRTNVFSVKDLDFDMQSRSLLLNTADWFLHGTIRDTIQQKLTMDLSSRLAQAREMAGKAVARVKLADKVYLSGNVKSVTLNDVLVRKDRLSIQLSAEGDTGIVFH